MFALFDDEVDVSTKKQVILHIKSSNLSNQEAKIYTKSDAAVILKDSKTVVWILLCNSLNPTFPEVEPLYSISSYRSVNLD